MCEVSGAARSARAASEAVGGLATTYTQQQRDRVEAHAALGLSYGDLLAEAGAHLRLECVQDLAELMVGLNETEWKFYK